MGLKLGLSHRLRAYKNRVLGKIFGPSEQVTGEWRRLHYEELYGLYSSPNIFRTIKSRRMRRAGQMARVRDRRGVYKVLVERHEGRNHLADLGIEGGNC